MAIPAFVALRRENNALQRSAGKNASLRQKGNFEPSPHRFEECCMHPPDPETRRVALEQGDPQISQRLSKAEVDTTAHDLQARRLRQRYVFGYETALLIAALAYAGEGS